LKQQGKMNRLALSNRMYEKVKKKGVIIEEDTNNKIETP
jgi:hypothetical protein